MRAGLDGIRRNLPLAPAIDRDPADLTADELAAAGITPLPVSLEAALAALDADAEALGWFSPTLLDVYRKLKLWECARARDWDEETLFARYRSAY